MMKPLFWMGVSLTALGLIVLLVFVVPHAGVTQAAPQTYVATGPHPLAVGIAGFGLAAGLALIGIGYGKWKRPDASPEDGHPEV